MLSATHPWRQHSARRQVTKGGDDKLPREEVTLAEILRDLVYAREGSFKAAVQDGKWKPATYDGGSGWRLHDLSADPAEKTDLSADHPSRVATLKAAFKQWQASCQRSATGADNTDS